LRQQNKPIENHLSCWWDKWNYHALSQS